MRRGTQRFGLAWMLAWRITRSRKSRFLSLITTVSIVGIALGVMALTIVVSVTAGFESSFRDRILGLHPHLLVWPRTDDFVDYRKVMKTVSKDPHVLGVTPATYDEMMVAHGDRRAGTIVKGVDAATVNDVIPLDTLVTEGSLGGLNEMPTITPRSNGGFELRNLVAETAWTVIVWGDDPTQRSIIANDLLNPDIGDARLTVFHADSGLGTIDVSLDTDIPAVLQTLMPGNRGRPISMISGPLALRLGKRTTTGSKLALESGETALLVLRPNGGEELITWDLNRPLDGEARVRIVDVRADAQTPIRIIYNEQALESGRSHTVTARTPTILLASALAKRLDAQVGDTVSVSTPYRGLGLRGIAPMGMEPSSGRFQVGGIFRTGYYDYDKRFAVVAFDAATRFLNTGDRAKWLEVRVDDLLQIDDRKRRVEDMVQPYAMADMLQDFHKVSDRVQRVTAGEVRQYPMEEPESALAALRNNARVMESLRTSVPYGIGRKQHFNIITWREMNAPLFGALKLQKNVLSIIFAIIILVAAFNIVGTQIMLVHEKTREIAILKAMGATSGFVRTIFVLQGLFVSSLGTLFGLILGLGACLLVDRVGYPLEPEVYLISELPVNVDYLVVVLIATVALSLTLVSTLYSAGKAGKLLPAQGIRTVD